MVSCGIIYNENLRGYRGATSTPQIVMDLRRVTHQVLGSQNMIE